MANLPVTEGPGSRREWRGRGPKFEDNSTVRLHQLPDDIPSSSELLTSGAKAVAPVKCGAGHGYVSLVEHKGQPVHPEVGQEKLTAPDPSLLAGYESGGKLAVLMANALVRALGSTTSA